MHWRGFFRLVGWLVVVQACWSGPIALAQPQDAPGAEDHPMVSRYEGAFIDGYEVRDFDSYRLALGPVVRNEAKERVPEASTNLEGRITRILYRGPKGRSTLEILSNYRDALEAAGFELLFTCGGDCGNNFSTLLYGPTELRITSSKTSGSAFDLPEDLRYLAARSTSASRQVHVAVMTAFDKGFSPLSKQPVTLLEVIESESMETDKVTVDAEAMARGIDANGHMAIYGVLFDTDSAEIKPGSAETLEQIAALLGNRPVLHLHVVGHTDSQGDYDYNLRLSAQRAESVVRALTRDYGVDGQRLHAAGVGVLAPVASNSSPEGRARNRRVELVRR